MYRPATATPEGSVVALSEIDRHLLERCLSRQTGAWEDFVDRFLGLVVHVVNHSAQSRSIRLTQQDREDLSAEVLLALVKDDFAVLRHFRGQSSLATFLTVVARRVVVRSLLKRNTAARLTEAALQQGLGSATDPEWEARLADREELERLLDGLDDAEAQLVRLFHLEGRTYQEMTVLTGIPENTIGPMLSRAREKMRRASASLPAPNSGAR